MGDARCWLPSAALLVWTISCLAPSTGEEQQQNGEDPTVRADGGTATDHWGTEQDGGQATPLECGSLPRTVTEAHWGEPTDHLTTSKDRLVLMGGGAEVDEMSRFFVEGAHGGDVAVFRASGSVTSYLEYFGAEVGAAPAPAQVYTIRLDEPDASTHEGVLCRVLSAESFWLAGGDQWNYLGQWSDELHHSIAQLLSLKRTVGGTSAGAMVWGQWAFDARWGSVSSEEALHDPLGQKVSLQETPFGHTMLSNTLVDTHFSEREREGRLLVFMARMALAQDAQIVRGLGLDGSTAISIEDGAFTVRSNANGAAWYYEASAGAVLEPGEPLSWDAITRVRLGNGAFGQWPPLGAEGAASNSYEVHRLSVSDGVIQSESVE